MSRASRGFLLALMASLALHAGLLPSWGRKPAPPVPDVPLEVRLAPEPVVKPPPPKPSKAARLAPVSAAQPVVIEQKTPLSLPAPPVPTAAEWQLASTYTPRNSKRYRHTWGQQVRSMMGTVVEGPGQGAVRFRIEIAPDGKLVKVEELWSTSALASRLAMNAIQNMPPLPPTPTGKPLIFEQTISYWPYESGWPPNYRLDCLPEPEAFKNPFAQNGSAPPDGAARTHRPPPPEGCIPDSTEDSIEEEERSFKRQLDQWRWAS